MRETHLPFQGRLNVRVYTAPKGATIYGGAGEPEARLRGNNLRHLAAPSCSPFVCSLHSQPQRWLEYGRLASLPLAILPIPPDSPLAASPTGRARLESPVNGDSLWVCDTMCQFSASLHPAQRALSCCPIAGQPYKHSRQKVRNRSRL